MSKSKFLVNPELPGKQICTGFRNALGAVLVLVPGTTVELESAEAAKVMEQFPGRLVPVATPVVPPVTPKGPGEGGPKVVTKGGEADSK